MNEQIRRQVIRRRKNGKSIKTDAVAVRAFQRFACSLGSVASADVYNGNGNKGFGGPVGTGSLTVTNSTDASGNPAVTFTFDGGSGHPTLDGNDLVLYLSTGAPGLSDTSKLSDNGDGGREAISGYDAGSNTRSLVTFASGFQATYAVSIQDAFVGLFHLVNLTNPPALDYDGAGTGPGVTQSSASGGPDTTTIPLSVLGVTPGQTIEFVGTDNATGDYRSNEAIGPSDASSSMNVGNTGALNFSGYDSFTTAAAAPEPTSIALFGLGAGSLMIRRRRLVASL